MTVTRQFLTEGELCELLGISRPTLFRWRRDGTSPTFTRLGPRRIAYAKTDVDAWLAKNRAANFSEQSQ